MTVSSFCPFTLISVLMSRMLVFTQTHSLFPVNILLGLLMIFVLFMRLLGIYHIILNEDEEKMVAEG